MPTYEFKHDVNDCNHEWEEFRSIKDADPTICPKCEAEGNIIHLISGGSGKGIVELSGHELVAKTKDDITKLKSDMRTSEKVYANMLGEGKYQELQTRIDANKRYRRG